jgi:hypothetical protein
MTGISTYTELLSIGLWVGTYYLPVEVLIMNLNKKTQNDVASRLKYLMDSESVSKDKRYKLGVWLHGEYKNKLVKARRT